MGTDMSIDELRALIIKGFEDLLDHNGDERDKIWDAYVNATNALNDLAERVASAPTPEPIKDTRVYVQSASRYGITHTVTVTNGVLRCTCESATFHPERGPCRHALLTTDDGTTDPRATWGGGLNGFPAPSFNIQELLLG